MRIDFTGEKWYNKPAFMCGEIVSFARGFVCHKLAFAASIVKRNRYSVFSCEGASCPGPQQQRGEAVSAATALFWRQRMDERTGTPKRARPKLLERRTEILMQKKLTSRIISALAALCMLLALFPATAFAADDVATDETAEPAMASMLAEEAGPATPVTYADGDVAQVGDTYYTSLDQAVEEAAEGSTIVLLQDCELTKGFNKTLTFTGGHKITINKQLTSNGEGWMCFGLYDPSRVLTFDDVEVEWNSEVGTAPWLMLSLSGTMNVTNGAKVTFTVDSGSTGSRNAIYLNAGSSINVSNGSTFIIYGYSTDGKEGQGLQLNQTGTASVNVTGNSTFLIDGTNRGYVNSPSIYVEDSTFTVQNCTANASNGGNFTAVDSKINYLNNAGHGLSAGNVRIENSQFVADNNGYYGIYASSGFCVDSTSTVTVTENSDAGDYAGLKITSGVTDGLVKAGAVVTITGNYCSGLSNNGTLTVEDGVALTIMDNVNEQGGATGSHGGGIYNSGANAKLTIPANTVIYNNHALTDGDDIYNSGTITFGQVGEGWALDEAYDCDHRIDGWYDDSEGSRWKAHAETEEGNHIEEFTDFSEETGLATITGKKALKAAHGVDAIDKPSYPGLDKTVQTTNEEGATIWGESDTAAAGENVNFKLETNVPDDLLNYIIPDVDDPEVTPFTNVPIEDRGEYKLVIHDQMDDELTFNPESVVVTLGDTELSQEEYSIAVDVAHADKTTCDFEITIDLVALYEMGAITDEDIENATPIVVTYTAKLSDDVEAGKYENTAWVTYPTDDSKKDTVTVDTYGITVFKYDQADESALEGAKFELYQKDAEGNVIEGSVITLTSDEDGYATIEGLDAGTYYLKETEAPKGYICSDEEVSIVIPTQANTDNMVEVKFANSLIPHTGGTGTLMYTVGGAAIIVLAGVLFFVSRKSRKGEDR